MEDLLKKKELLEESLETKQKELNVIIKQIQIVKNEIYNTCNHDFKIHVENCAYPETFYICSKCGYEE